MKRQANSANKRAPFIMNTDVPVARYVAARMDEERYAQLLREVRPAVIETPEEHERLLTAAEALMDKGEALSAEERKLLVLLVFLIESFESQVDEDDNEPVAPPNPHETLRRLIESRGMEIADVTDVFGNSAAAKEALEGRRPITRGQARQLGRLFRVPPKLFQL